MSARKLSTVSMSIARVPGVAIVLGALCATFGVMSPGFLTPANIANILTQSTILLLLALPMTVIIMTEGLDLSIGAVLTLASIMLAVTVVATVNGGEIPGQRGGVKAGQWREDAPTCKGARSGPFACRRRKLFRS